MIWGNKNKKQQLGCLKNKKRMLERIFSEIWQSQISEKILSSIQKIPSAAIGGVLVSSRNYPRVFKLEN
jgi:hypothetical protein